VDRLRGLSRLFAGATVVSLLCPVAGVWELVRFRVSGTPDLLAPFTLLTVPAALATLWVWQRTDEERERAVASGDDIVRIRAARLRKAAFGMLLFATGSMIAQLWVLGSIIARVTGEGG
jgi:hypothetical protein